MRRWLKRIISVIFMLAAAILLIFGPRPDETPAGGKVIVQYWEKWPGKERAAMESIVDWFNRTVGEEKGIYVQYLSMSNINQKTLVSTAGGVPPDVAGLWDVEVAQFASMGALLPLDEMAAAHGITEDYYKPVYWNACRYNGVLYALISTPAATALHYNKQIFLERADALRAAGLDPDRPPRTLRELDEYAKALDVIETLPNGRKHIISAGYLPMEPGWFLAHTGYWFGVSVFDEQTQTLQLNHPKMVEALEWIQSYSKRLGVETMGEFRSGFGTFNSTQNPFLTGMVAMVKQGPWMANYIEHLKPEMNRWKMSKEQEATLPREQRKQNYAWAAAPFPSAVPGLENVSYCGFDTLVIPRGARHPKEAFEFIAFVNRQDVMERLNTLHCKNSPLTKVSDEFLENHPNPYIDVFEQLASSPNARALPSIGIWPQVAAELNNAIQEVYLLRKTPQQALDDAQRRSQWFYNRFLAVQEKLSQ